MQPFTAEFARTQLSPCDKEFEIGKYRYRAAIGEGEVIEHGPDGQRSYSIAHVMGGKNVYYFLSPMDRGRLQTLPLAYDVRRQEWYDTARSGVRHFPGRTDEEPLHWTDREFTFNTSCYSCHVSQISTNYDLESDSYNTVWGEPGINCETCHGPGVEHVRVCRDAPEGTVPEDLKIIRTTAFTVGQTNTMCAPCHAKMSPVTNTFQPGDRYFDHFDLTTLEHPDFYPDGRDLGENYTLTSWRMSPCVKSGEMDCLHCHTSSGRFRFKDEPNNACLPCHKHRVENAAAHTKHPPDSEGNLCIRCHMPKTEFAQMARSDHSMLPPTPATTIAYKSPNACNLCHMDKDAQWSDRWVREWRTRDYQAPVLRRAALVDAARKGDWSRLPEMLEYVTSEDRDEVFTNSLIRLLQACENESKWPGVVKALQDPSPLVRASAAESLGNHLTRETVDALLEATRDDYRLVRVRAAAALAPVPPDMLEEQPRKDLEQATAEFLASVKGRPDDAASHHNLGNFYSSRRQYGRAVNSFEASARLDPRSIPPLVNASLAFNAMGRNGEAEASLRRALKIDADNVAVNLNLGLLLAEMDRMREAERALRVVLKADPKQAVAAYNLGVILAQHDKVREGIEWCRKAAELRPDEPNYAYTLAFYLRQVGDTQGAIGVLEQMLNKRMPHAGAYAMLGEVYEAQGEHAKAIEVYRQAAANEGLRDRERYQFATRAEVPAKH
jgi:tetratricopeptide (TPR) repeat protein